MIFYRAVSRDELDDLNACRVLRPGPPSYQGKWVMPSLSEVATMGRKLYAFDQEPFHIVELELVGKDCAGIYVLPKCDLIGPAYFFGTDQLNRLRFVSEVVNIPLGET